MLGTVTKNIWTSFTARVGAGKTRARGKQQLDGEGAVEREALSRRNSVSGGVLCIYRSARGSLNVEGIQICLCMADIQ